MSEIGSYRGIDMSLRIENVTTIYKNNKMKEIAIEDISLEINKGEFVGVLGRSGAGKSTFIRSINQLVKPSKGKVFWNGIDITSLKGRSLRNIRLDIGMIFQQFHLIPRLTVLQNALIGSFGYRPLWKNILGVFSKEEHEIALNALRRVGIDHLADKRVDQLSGGQQQRVAIARVIVQQPRLLLGDEPVASLDPVTSNQVMTLIKDIHLAEKMTTIINIHDVTLALKYCDRIIGMSNGHIVFDGKPEEVDENVLKEIYGEHMI